MTMGRKKLSRRRALDRINEVVKSPQRDRARAARNVAPANPRSKREEDLRSKQAQLTALERKLAGVEEEESVPSRELVGAF